MFKKILLFILLFTNPSLVTTYLKRLKNEGSSAKASPDEPSQPAPAPQEIPVPEDEQTADTEPIDETVASPLEDFVLYHDGTLLSKYTGRSEVVRVPDGVKEINIKAFTQEKYEKIWIEPSPDSYRSDSSRAEEYRWAAGKTSMRSYSTSIDFLSEVILPDSVEKIGMHAFERCINLKHIRLSANLREIGLEAFLYCSSLRRIDLPDGFQRIATSAFRHCRSLEYVRLPEGLRSIMPGAFCFCSELKSIVIPESLREIERNTFSYCKSLSQVRLPDGLLRIHSGAFEGCSSLKRIEIPADTIIDENAFKNTDVEIVRRPKAL